MPAVKAASATQTSQIDIPDVSDLAVEASNFLTTSGAEAVASTVAAAERGSPEFILAAGLGIVLVGLLAVSNLRKPGAASEDATSGGASRPVSAVPRKDAVLVFGATGQTGKLLVQKLLQSGRTVVAACRDQERAEAVLIGELGLRKGLQEKGPGILALEADVNIRDASTLTDQVFQGVTQVVMALGAVYKQSGGGFAVVDGMTSELVEGEGIPSIVSRAASVLPRAAPSEEVVIPAAKLAQWDVKDDVIMGGSSSSGVTVEGANAIWAGTLVVEGGGFCGLRSPHSEMDLSKYDGLSLRVRGEGQIFKLSVKTLEQAGVPESAYQATFDTVAGEWTTVHVPWHEFVPVKRAKWDPEGAPLDASKIAHVGLVLSRFEFNGMPNPSYTPGPFKLELAQGVSGYTRPRPSIVLLSSGGVERNAIIGDNSERRATDIPIVQLNPGGTLNWKYKAEMAVRASGLPYSIVRATGFTTKEVTEPYSIEMGQGDRLSGQSGRGDAADMLAAALACSDSVQKTVEIRRSFNMMTPGAPLTLNDIEAKRLFLTAALDRNRWRIGLNPFPAWVAPSPAPAPPAPPAAPPSKESNGAPPIESGGKPDDSAARRSQVGAWIAGYRKRSSATKAATPSAAPAKEAPAKPAVAKAAAAPAAQAAPTPAAAGTSPAANAESARKWIATWRASSKQQAPASAGSEARAWINAWNAKQKGAKQLSKAR